MDKQTARGITNFMGVDRDEHMEIVDGFPYHETLPRLVPTVRQRRLLWMVTLQTPPILAAVTPHPPTCSASIRFCKI